MRASHSVVLIGILFLLDLIAVVFAGALATYWTDSSQSAEPFYDHFRAHFSYIIAFLIAWPVVAIENRLLISRRRDDLLSLVFDIAKCVALSLIFAGFVVTFYAQQNAEPRFFSYFGLTTLLFIALFRLALHITLRSFRTHGYNKRQILIVGANDRSQHLVRTIQNNKHFGYRFVGFIEEDPERFKLIEQFGLKQMGDFAHLKDILANNVVDEVFLCLPVRSHYATIQEMAHKCEQVGVSVRMLADLFPLRLASSRFHKLDDIPILALSTVPENKPQLVLQRVTDILIAATALGLFSPILLATTLAIKLTSPGPIFFNQQRVDLYQRPFNMIKFRSMVLNAEALREEVATLNETAAPVFKIAKDPRLTKIGGFLRKYSIDELPQLINVLKGDMSLVGPRPPLTTEVTEYSWSQRRRLSIKPGMTGLSQVSGRSDLSLKDTVDLDLFYIDRWSLALVFRILLRTIPALLKGRGAV